MSSSKSRKAESGAQKLIEGEAYRDFAPPADNFPEDWDQTCRELRREQETFGRTHDEQ